ncbi:MULTISPECIES: PilX N-terminal domain-containing pilus assembly protein [unclassified Acidovorax]|uniref:pilus assembly PilX family protein n=1 Tax=unclassified Acidovorax TaxID=2684926 RepID=UPI0025BC67E1|nr:MULTISPECIES: PilX N-terminal domain-containing pilus assembly protein [unclassified Acidovorax]HQS19529.1 PilX N-terminal domain-containing pilus assembly protein [Acidovorax defluvii]HQS64758.1 PilX N-terminal domain-containing pilus assembly protein [Acidovorax defluvii]HQT16891.1 PilX N-terminal domain-containing pilus assembly protein [Acidovorax defluvii]HQT48066.1 PilX N-terminal domain-containing pilus assembly protein [Acidovorax defluvii]
MPHSPRPDALRPAAHCGHGQPLPPVAVRQRGVALFVVIVFVMLSMLLALWASRTSLFNEMVVGNDADYQRAFEAAQALLQDAELDIRGEMADGNLCSAPPCRAYSSALQFPGDTNEINPLITVLESKATRCQDGLCARRVGRQDFWNYATAETTITPAANTALGEVPLSDLMAVGARYGQFTGAQLGSTTAPANPILADPDAGRYWIEIMRYSDTAKSANLIVDSTTSQLPLNLDVYVVFRITALAVGRKPGTTVVLQETYARQRTKD